MAWEKISKNEVLRGEGFFISFLPSSGREVFSDFGPFGHFFSGDNDGGSETAIVVPNGENNRYYILNGDFREAYESLVPKGKEACIAFYNQHPENHSSWSTRVPEEES